MLNERITHDVFISYSRTDTRFAKLLERMLESYTPPPGLGLPSKRLRVFLDTSDIRGADYDEAIDRELAAARNLIVLCSPAARQSEFVNDEIRRFLALRRKAAEEPSVVPLLVDGIPNNEIETLGDEDAKAFPEALYEIARMPLAQDFRNFDLEHNKLNAGAFRDAWFATLATLLGIERHALEERDRRRAARRRNFIVSLAFSVITVLSLTTIYAIRQQNIAETQRDLAQQQLRIAQAGELAAQSRFLSDRKAYLLRPSMLLAIESLRKNPSPQGTNALQRGLSLLLSPEQTLTVGRVEGALYTPDGRWLVTANPGGEVQFTSLAGSDDLRAIRSPAAIKGIAMSPDGSRIATAGRDGVARVFDSVSGEEISSLPHDGYLDNVAFGSDGASLLTASQKANRVTLWNLRDDTVEAEFEVSTTRLDRPGMAATLSPDGRWLAATGHGTTALVWDLESPGDPIVLEHDGWVVAHAFSPSGQLLVTAGEGQKARLWQVGDWYLVRDIQHDSGFGEGSILDLAISGDGHLLATASTRSQQVGAPSMFGASGLVRVWDLATGAEVGRAESEGSASIVSFSADGRSLVAGGDGRVRIWTADPGHAMNPLLPPEHLITEAGRWFTVSADGEWIAATYGRTAVLWEVSTGQVVNSLEVDGRYAGPLAFAPDASRLAIATAGGSVVWDFVAGVSRLLSHTGRQGTAAISFVDGGNQLAAASVEAFWRWDLESELPAVTHAFEEEKDHSLALSEGGQRFAIAGGRIYMNEGSPSTARVWDVATGNLVQTLKYQGVAGTMAFSRTAERLVTGGEGGNVRVWSLGDGRLLANTTHDDSVRSVAISADDAWIASASRDGTVKVWDSASGEEVSRLELNDDPAALRFDPTDGTLWIRTRRGAILRREWRPEEMIASACSRLTGNFTAAEWREYMGDGPNRPICDDLPVPSTAEVFVE